MSFQSPNYTPVPNDFFDMAADMSEAELRFTLVLLRETFGYHIRSVKMTVTKIARAAKMTRDSVYTAAEKALARGTVIRQGQGSNAIWTVNVVDTSESDKDTPSVDVADTKCPSNGHSTINKERKKNINAVSPPRPRDPLFDAITTTCRVDPATAGSGIAKAKQRLTKAAPPYTAEDVAAFGRWWVKQYGADRPPTVWQLAERIGVIRTAAAKPSLGMYFEED